MHLFVSAGEPSGDLHAANLVRAILAREPAAKVVGYGGDRLAAAGVSLHYPLTRLAVMWLGRALLHLPEFFKQARRSEVYFRTAKPDAVILTDYPGFHFALAKRAHRAGVPVYYFVPPQLWAWAGWRSEKMRKWVTAVLTALPFEEDWYAARGVRTHYVGHPYFDEIAHQRLDADFLAAERATPGPVVALLPGSRKQEVQDNFALMLAAAQQIHAARPDVRFLVAGFSDRLVEVMKPLLAGTPMPVTVHVGRTPEIIELATGCVSVSGSVSLEMMCRLKPAVVVYKIAPVGMLAVRVFKKAKYITLVNLIAGAELYPEFLTTGTPAREIAGHVLGWLDHPAARAELVEKLRVVRDRAAVPGACERAADFILQDLRARRPGAVA